MKVLRRARGWPEPGFARGAGKSTSVQAKRASSGAVRAAAAASLEDAGPIGSDEIRELQRSAGNRATTELLSGRRRDSGGRARSAVQRSVGGAPRVVVQRHLPGALAKVAGDIVKTRETMRAYNPADPTNGNLLDYIKKHASDINALPNLVKVVKTKPELITALAEDMADQAGTPVDDAHREAARKSVMDDGGGGFTAKNGQVFMLESSMASSALYHELIHVLSGDGGVNQLSKTKVNLNEGFTNYFAEELATKYGEAIFTAYPVATAFVRDLVGKITQNTAYNIYFKDNEALLYSTLATRVKTKVEAIKTGFESPDNKATEIKGVKKNQLSPFLKGGAIKSDAELAELVKKNFVSGSFLEATEPGIAWLRKWAIDD